MSSLIRTLGIVASAIFALLVIVAVVTALRLPPERRPLGAYDAAKEPTTPTRHVDFAGDTGNLSVIALADDALAQRGIAKSTLGDLDLPSGSIVVADPVVTPERPALARTVAPGRYPVTLYRAQQRVALAELRFAPGAPVRWQIAVIPGQDAGTLKADEIFGYPVDAGLGSFMDVEALAALDERERQEKAKRGKTFISLYDDVLAEPLGRNGDTELLFKPLHNRQANIAIFQSGSGDGHYASYWGLDEAGRPLVLVTDFNMLERGDGRSPAERWTAATLAAMSPEQRRYSAAGYAALKSGDLATFESLLREHRIAPETPVAERNLPFTAIAIMDDRAGALDLLVRHGAASAIAPEIGLVWKRYPDLAGAYEKATPDAYTAGEPPKPRSPELMAVVRRWESAAPR